MMDQPTIFSAPNPETPAKPPLFLRLIKKPWFIFLLVCGLVGLALAFSINRIMIALLHAQPEVVVPKLEGKSLTEALAIVSPLDLSIQQEGTDFDDTLPAGTILRQQPPSGMNVRSGRAVRVVISKGGQVVFIPDISGKPLAEAQSMLATDGIQMGGVTEAYSMDIPKNSVLSQSPNAGTVVTRGAFVDVEVSKGPPPAGLPLLPNFVGQTVDQARTWATDVNAQVKVKEDAKVVVPAGVIVKQDPSAGQPLMEDQDILVIVPAGGSNSGKRISFLVPSGEKDAVVRVMARNDKGEFQVYEGKHAGGTPIEIPVSIAATTRFRIYVNDVLKDEQVLEP